MTSEGGAQPDAEPDQESVARTILLGMLTGRARTRAELTTKLRQRNVPEETAQRLLDRFEEVGLVDDANYARSWVEQRHRGRGLARRALAAELHRKGVPEEAATESLGAVTPEAEEQMARILVQSRLPRVAGLSREVAMRRLVGMLARKGYSSGLALQVCGSELERSLRGE